MSVMQCDRGGCENIMCDRYSSLYGYLCDECFEELITSGTWNIEYFMGTPRPQVESPSLEWYEGIFNKESLNGRSQAHHCQGPQTKEEIPNLA